MSQKSNPKKFQRMGSLGERTRAFFSKFKKKKSLSFEKDGITEEDEHHHHHHHEEDDDIEDVVIVGAGIVGLVLALALHTHAGITPIVYEQAPAFHDDVGAGMGMYPNGLRVIRDISPDLLKDIHNAGYPYLYRRWERHDGTQVAVSEEKVLSANGLLAEGAEEDPDLQPLGIRRWRLQKLLYQAAQASGIPIHFNKRLEQVVEEEEKEEKNKVPTSVKKSNEKKKKVVHLTFQDGTLVKTQVLLAADGSKSRVRNLCTAAAGCDWKMEYTGVTCLMGTSSTPRQDRGICLPASETTKCHGAFYPTGPNEQCFQFHFPTPAKDAEKAAAGSWGTLTEHVGQEECNILKEKLKLDGWDDKYLEPLEKVDKAIKIGFSVLEPPLKSYVYGNVVLLGDSAHPPVPYLGQGAQQGLEDAGTLALLFQHLLMVNDENAATAAAASASAKFENGEVGQEMAPPKKFSTANLDLVLRLYNTLRVPRTQAVLEHSKAWGKVQQKRTECARYNKAKEEKIIRDVFFHETVSDLLLGVRHDYKSEVLKAIATAAS